MRHIFITLVLLLNVTIQAQDQGRVDSLTGLLDTRLSPQDQVEALIALSKEYRSVDSALTNQYTNQAISLAKEINYGKGVSDALYVKGSSLLMMGYFDEATMLYTNSLQQAESEDYTQGMANAYNGLGAIQWYQGYYDKAKMYFEDAIRMLEKVEKYGQIAKIYNNLASIYYKLGQYQKSLELHFKSLEIKEDFNDKKGMAYSLSNIGLIFKERGDYQKALDYYFKSLKLREELNDQMGKIDSYANIGEIYESQGDHYQALKFFNQSLQKAVELKDRADVAKICINIGNSWRKLQNYDSSLFYFRWSARLCEEIGSQEPLGALYHAFGDTYADMGDLTRSREHYEKAIAVQKQLGHQPDLSGTYIALGKLFARSNNPEKAEQYLKMGIELAEELETPILLMDGAKALSDIFYTKGRVVSANQYLQLYSDLRDSVQSEKDTRKIVWLEAEYEFRRKRDSLELGIARERMAYESELEKRRINQQAIVVVLSLALGLSAMIIIFYRTKSRDKKRIENQRDDLSKTLDDLKRTQKMLIQSEKMASLGVLSAGIAHEINNPLNYIQGGADELNRIIRERSDEELESISTLISSGVHRISGITRSLGRYSHQGTGLNENCRLHDILENCVMLLESKLKDRIRVHRQYATNIPPFKCSSGAMHQVFINLLANAEQAIEEEGEIVITTEYNNNMLKISIADNGIGIDKEHFSKLSDPFFTTKPPGEGTGLGLYITYDIVKAHNGNVSFESELGIGTEFVITFPVKEMEVA